ncbi:MAG TPA: flagellar biosynthetic protein FliR [Acidobacteriaceae bacterium]|nr:flagellar biosynthetic protein FliR [Acidobacteriaceae bacterium]
MIELPLLKIIAAFLAISVRLTGLLLFAPFFGSIAISPQIKAALVVAFSVLLYPVVSQRLMNVELSHWPMVVLGELLIGAAMGIATNLVFDAVQMAGQVLSVQMGFSLVTLLDPQTNADSTVVATFHQTIAMLIFLRMDVHLWLLGAIGRSFELLPPGAMHLSAAFTTLAVRAGGEVFVLGLQMAAPVFSATLLTDLALGLLGRASPSMPLMLLGPPVKMLLGLAILFAALKYWPSMLGRFFESSMSLSSHLLLLAR